MRPWVGLLLVAAAPAAELPVRQVILYKHGVGYFERSGELGPGQSARLEFKAGEMNDVLKSLTVNDAAGGKIAGLRYDSSQPLSRRLSEFPFKLNERQALSAFLDQLKGARLELRFGPETVAGLIVGARALPAEEKRAEREQVLLMLDSGEMRALDLSGASSLRFPDPALQLQLKEYLAAVAGARSRDSRSVYIDSSDAGARRIQASYMIPTPVWKSSYRLLVGAQGEPLLEGWAIVDNTTAEDWTNIKLSLVSGRPISFISQLYEPRYRERPTAELPEDQAQAPVIHEGAVAQAAPPPPPAPAMAPAPLMSRLRASRATPEMTVKDQAESAVEPSSVAPAAEGRELGELFEYRFSSPVTVRKNESAMLPFLQQKLAARKLLIFSDRGSPHPTNAAEITNNTGKTLDGGPITVFDSGAYAGEALMETLKSGDKRLISYAVDLGTRVDAKIEPGAGVVREILLRRGLLTTRSAAQQTHLYTIRNVDSKPKTLIIEHPIRPGYKLLNQKPAETTSSAYRFEVRLAPGASDKLPVAEERVYETSVAVVNLTPDVLLTYVQNRALSEAARQQLTRILEVKRRIAEADASIRQTETEINEITRDQERIRQNINSLNRVSGQQEQVQKYARELAAQEGQLAGLRDRLAELRKKKTALESELNLLIEKTEI